ncbi:GNAT family N-acetyltransferase [Burkholderia glumae]|uniref:GNAT family N-acetyltransferase n=1 Tax=Burkholderia glumae TaxID=337 RepID=UPI0020B29C64|nr:GNAT family N-acetyltransferase [Burkholderia glumae]
MRYFSFPPMTEPAQARARAARLARDAAAGNESTRVVESPASGEPPGDCSLFDHDAPCRSAQHGFSRQRRHWGHDYMSEAVSALLGHGFDPVGLRRVEADVDPRNAAGLERHAAHAPLVRPGSSATPGEPRLAVPRAPPRLTILTPPSPGWQIRYASR